MKKNLLKSMLFAMVMGFATSAWAQTSTLVDLPSNPEEGWTEADATWDAGSVTPTIFNDKSAIRISGSNGSYAMTKTIAPTANAIINVKAVWRGRSDTGRAFSAGNGSYFRFGNIVVAQNDQDKKHGYCFTGIDDLKSVTMFTAGNYRVDISDCTWLLIEMEINTANNALTSFSIKSEDGETTYATAEGIVLANADYTTVAFGYKKAGSVSTTNTEDLKSLTITQTEQVVQTADYTVKYVDAAGTEIKEAATRTGIVGQDIVLNADDMVDFYLADGSMKYIYVSNDAEGKTIAEDNSTVVTVTFREAAKYNWTAKSNVGTYTISGITFEGDKASVKYPLYQLVDGTLWTKGATDKVFAQSFDITEDNQEIELEYTETEITNVIYYAEIEDVEGMTVYAGGNAEARASQRAVGYSAAGSTKFTKLGWGKYKMTGAFYSPTSAGGHYTIYAGNRVIWEATTDNANITNLTSDEFVIPSDCDILLGQGGYTQAVDYIYIQMLDDPTDKEVEEAEAADALATAKAELQAAINDAKQAVADSKEKIEGKAQADNPEISEEELAALVESFNADINAAIQEAEAALAKENATVDELNEATNTLKAATETYQNKVTTGISEVKTAQQQNGAIYNLAGQRVAKAQKGLYIINGNKVVVK